MEGTDKIRSDGGPRRARRGDPWPVRLQAARRIVAALRAERFPPIPGDWLTVLNVGAQEAERFRAVLLEHRTDLRAAESVEDEVTARFIAVMLECDPACAHTRRPEDPPSVERLPFYLLLAHRQIVCRICFARDWSDRGRRPPTRIPDDRCDWCEARTETFHEHILRNPTFLIFSNACGPCHRAMMREGAAGADVS
jgi:hypothetical protein